jgi:hypothetical protein
VSGIVAKMHNGYIENCQAATAAAVIEITIGEFNLLKLHASKSFKKLIPFPRIEFSFRCQN